jgi:hypothetical protein
MLFGQVDQVKVDGERPGYLFGRRQAPGRNQLRDLVPGRIGARLPVTALAAPRLDHRVPQPLHVGQQLLACGVPDDLAEDVAEQPHIVPHRLRQRGAVPLPGPVHVAVHG